MFDLMLSVCLAVAAAAVFGLVVLRGHASVEWERLRTTREVIAAEWQELQQTQRVREVYYEAREALRDAQRGP